MRDKTTLIADGKCALELEAIDWLQSDTATILELTRWALRMVNMCTINDEEVQSGRADYLGW